MDFVIHGDCDIFHAHSLTLQADNVNASQLQDASPDGDAGAAKSDRLLADAS